MKGQRYQQVYLLSIVYALPFITDAPKILGSVAVYTWEGNPANISCEVLAHPSDVSITWLRDGFQLPNANTSNIKIYNTPSASYLEVRPTQTPSREHKHSHKPRWLKLMKLDKENVLVRFRH